MGWRFVNSATHSAANLGDARKGGLSFIHAPGSKQVTDVVAEKGTAADLKIRNLGNGRFELTDRHGSSIPSRGGGCGS